MSETKQKPWTGTPECGDPEHFYNSETGYVECNTCSRLAEPVIEVAPGEYERVKDALREARNDTREIRQLESGDGWACVDCRRPQDFCKCPKPGRTVHGPSVAPDEPTCEYCGPVCYRGAEHNARVEDNYKFTDPPDVPAVPAQEAPRDKGENMQTLENGGLTEDDAHNIVYGIGEFAEPQAGAQELFPGANDMRAPTGMENLRDTPPIVYEGNMAFAQFVGVIEEACKTEPQAGARVPSQDGLDLIAQQICDEVSSAEAKWPAMNSAHEAYAVLLEEVDELKAHVWTNQKRRDIPAMRQEAIQVAAMAVRLIRDICDGDRSHK